MDRVLSVVFGLISVIAFAYAVWQNRSAENARVLAARVTGNIQQLAREIIADAPGTSASAYARSIAQISGSLTSGHKKGIHGSELGDVSLVFLAPQFQSEVATLALLQDSKFGVALTGTYGLDAWTPEGLPTGTMGGLKYDAVLAWGPYVTLPAAGRYVVEFRLRRGHAECSDDEALIYLDVYDYDHDKYYAQRRLTKKDLQTYWQRFSLVIEYVDTAAKLEYRVAVLRPGVPVTFDMVEVGLKTPL